MSAIRPTSSAEAPNPNRPADGTRPADEVIRLRLELWTARDAASGAIAEAGALRARNAELEALVNQLRVELDRLASVEQSITFRAGRALLAPAKGLRRLTR